MKPRIISGGTCLCVMGLWIYLPHGWHCSDGTHEGWGGTPKEAYDAWRTKSIAPRWKPGQVVEQHLCPPKPTLWQRVKREWGTFDCGVIFDRVY